MLFCGFLGHLAAAAGIVGQLVKPARQIDERV